MNESSTLEATAAPTEDQTPIDATPVPPEPVPLNVEKILSRLDILSSEDLATEKVRVPEWGGSVIVKALSGVERDAYEAGIFSSGAGITAEYNLQNIRAKLAARTMVDENGDRLFSDADVARLGLKSAAALDRVFSVAQRLSRLTASDVKELTVQLGNDQSAASGSA